MAIAPNAPLRLTLVAPSARVQGYLQRWRATLERMARIEGVDVADEPPPGSVAILVRDAQAALPLAGLVDFAAERARLAKEIDRERGEIAKADAKLNNPDFLFRAPEEIVEENRERRDAAAARIEKLEAALARVENL
jgi:valyl-tRNA synthetase